jgi:hypothetical protein
MDENLHEITRPKANAFKVQRSRFVLNKVKDLFCSGKDPSELRMREARTLNIELLNIERPKP